MFILLHLTNTKRNTRQSLLSKRQQLMEEDRNVNLQLYCNIGCVLREILPRDNACPQERN